MTASPESPRPDRPRLPAPSASTIANYRARGWWGDDTLDSLFSAALADAPERLALADQPTREALTDGMPQRLTYRQLAEEVEAYAAALTGQGIGANDTLLIQLPNISELVILYLAASRLGIVISPLPVQYGHHEIAAIAAMLQPAALIAAVRVKDIAFPERLATVPVAKRFWIGSNSPDPSCDFAMLVDAARGRSAPPIHNNADAVVTVCWTSGTTGTPKGVPRTHNQWWAIAKATYDAAELRDGDVLLNPFPFVNMASIGGFLYNWLACRGTLVLHHPLELPTFLKQIRDESVAFTVAPPALLTMLLKNDELCARGDLDGLRAVASGSAPLSPWMVAGFAEKLGIGVINLFGSNEGVCLASSPRDVPDPADRAAYFPRFGVPDIAWSSRVASLVETRLRNRDSGEIITVVGQPGELEIRGATLFSGYVTTSVDEGETVFTNDGYFRSGDMFEIAGEDNPPRFYRFVGRCREIISRGGHKIAPNELDGLLAAYPKLADVAAVGYPDEVLGEKICVFVVPKPGQSICLEEIVAFLREQGVATFKLPEQLIEIEALPRNPLGKVVRANLRAQLDIQSPRSTRHL